MLSVECLITPEHGYGTPFRSIVQERGSAEEDQQTGDLGAHPFPGHQPNIDGIATILVLPIFLFCVYCNDLLRI